MFSQEESRANGATDGASVEHKLVPKPNTKAPVWEYFGLEKRKERAAIELLVIFV